VQRALAMRRRVLITGGGGFIASHVADDLIARGHEVRALDVLVPQVHAERRRPTYLDGRVELVIGDIRDPHVVRRALAGIDVVYHFAARVGSTASMRELAEYTSVNVVGTAVLLEALADHPVERLVVASSMCVYGEGLYRDDHGHLHDRVHRTARRLAAGQWNPATDDGRVLTPMPTPEHKPTSPSSVYALSKYDQERMCLVVGEAHGIPTVALRLFNVYGPRHVSGVLSSFASRLLGGSSPIIYEDGYQQRDFVHVRDVAAACRLALEAPIAVGGVFNIASGRAITIREVAKRMGQVLGREITPTITRQHRAGDVRHCTADITQARRALGYAPRIDFDAGLRELAAWLTTPGVPVRAELATRGIAV
jgi:dTDP-L-rhamnose 4-epimerase